MAADIGHREGIGHLVEDRPDLGEVVEGHHVSCKPYPGDRLGKITRFQLIIVFDGSLDRFTAKYGYLFHSQAYRSQHSLRYKGFGITVEAEDIVQIEGQGSGPKGVATLAACRQMAVGQLIVRLYPVEMKVDCRLALLGKFCTGRS